MAPPMKTSLGGNLPISVPSAIAIILLLVVVVKPVVQALLSPLRRVPGPFLARFTRLWEMHMMHYREYALYSVELHKKYGPIVRIAPNRYSIDDAEAVKFLLGHKEGLDKTQFYTAFSSPDRPNTFSVTSKSVHAQVRRPIAQLYSQTNLLNYEPAVDSCNSILLKRLHEYAQDGKELDVMELMQYYAFDVIGEITVGSRFGIMEANGDKDGIIETIGSGLVLGTYIGLIPEVFWWIMNVGSLLGLDQGFRAVTKFFASHLEARVQGKTKSPEGRADFLDKLLPLEQEGKASRVDTWTACEQNIGAGSDTTGISLTAVFTYLATNPAALATLRRELDQARQAGELSNPATFKEAQKLPYLHAVINEALRMHPAVGFPLARNIGPNGATLAGQYFPPGTEVGVNPWVIHRNTTIFGPDAAEFRPERWLTDDPEERASLDRNMITFGSGPRTCIGKNISLLEMYKVVPQIVQKYDFDIVPDKKTGEPLLNSTAWFVWPIVRCVVKERTT